MQTSRHIVTAFSMMHNYCRHVYKLKTPRFATNIKEIQLYFARFTCKVIIGVYRFKGFAMFDLKLQNRH